MKMYILLTKADESIEMIDAGTFQTMRFGNQDYYVVPIPKREMPKAPATSVAAPQEPTKRKYTKTGERIGGYHPSELFAKVREAVMEEIVDRGGLYPQEMSTLLKTFTPRPAGYLMSLVKHRHIKKTPDGKWTLF